MARGHRDNTVGPWARQKLDALQAYLTAYMLVMKQQNFDLTYIDAFAGAGLSKLRSAGGGRDEATMPLMDYADIDISHLAEEEQFVAGSPRRALELDRPFDRYYFFERDLERIRMLQGLRSEFADRKIFLEQGDANDLVQRLAVQHLHGRARRAVAFLDPYGPHLHWSTLEALAATKHVDVIINFPLQMAINRLINNDGTISSGSVETLDALFGTHEWFNLVYSPRATLFGEELTVKTAYGSEVLLGLYIDRLKSIFSAVSAPSVVRTEKGHALYYLIWAGHKTGKNIADHILQLGDRITKRTSR